MGTPIAIASSGGGAGFEDPNGSTSPGNSTGGFGGGLNGGDGLCNAVGVNNGGTQTSGWQLFQGQSISSDLCPGGGGGAGFYGGLATDVYGTLYPGGGGGGSSFVLGAQGYNSTLFNLPDYKLEKFKVMPGSGSAVNPEDGWVKIDGVYYEKTYTYEPIYQFCDHELGDFYYQCAGYFVTPEKTALPPELPQIGRAHV